MGAVCGVAVESDAVRISYFRDGRRVEDSIDAEGARWLLNGKLVDCGPFDDVVLTGRDVDVVESLLASLDAGHNSTIRMVDEGAALLAYARAREELSRARSLLVLDLGRYGTSAFTLDVVAGDVVRSSRRSALSGEALDDIVERLVMDKDILPPANGEEARREYRSFFRELKELVAASAGVRAPGDGPMLLTRAEFEEAITSTLLQTLAWAAPTDPDAVLLIGGGANIPLVRMLVEQEWTVPLVLPESPSSVILEGAALEAAPSAPRLDLDDVLNEHDVRNEDDVLDGHHDSPSGVDAGFSDEPVLSVATVDEHEPPTTPMGVVSPAPAVSERAWVPTVAPVDTAVVGPAEIESAPSRRRLRWSLRDAAGVVGVAVLVLVVWAIVITRGDSPPPPGIGVEPAGTPTSETSVAEEAPPVSAPAPVPIGAGTDADSYPVEGPFRTEGSFGG